ncbi:LOW QUALITY PROTEIN: cardiolipin synthase (CMP-forming)-like [Haliotis rubra]|uniref:LOW QUALITY PROTEIN: cardiolipin synthase (CMP-forming)-like n=1 Tax=Haliotis rubra TaxID=36100 RepID=UPI001EE4F792|nr:LOW QUALITY PROTEIN: cardiolipin synthase (CMP-forming)-like [Haliotis rubra]
MSAPLRRVFPKHVDNIRGFMCDMSMSSLLPFCSRCSERVYSSLGLRRCKIPKLCTRTGRLKFESFANSRNASVFHDDRGLYRHAKQQYGSKRNHVSTSNTVIQIQRANLSAKRSFGTFMCRRKEKAVSVISTDLQKQSGTDCRILKVDVWCKNINSGPRKQVKEATTSSPTENIYTIPNLLTVGRMLSAPFLGYMVMSENFQWALGLFAFAGVSDLLDGYIARNFKNQNSILGSALDPMADKILVSVLVLTLTSVNLIPLPLTALIVGRDVALIAAAFYLRYITLPPPKTLSRYFDVTLVSAKLEPFLISKWNTAFQLSLVAFTLAAPVFNYVDHPLLQGLWYLTGSTTFISGALYVVYWRDSVKVLNQVKK